MDNEPRKMELGYESEISLLGPLSKNTKDNDSSDESDISFFGPLSKKNINTRKTKKSVNIKTIKNTNIMKTINND